MTMVVYNVQKKKKIIHICTLLIYVEFEGYELENFEEVSFLICMTFRLECNN